MPLKNIGTINGGVHAMSASLRNGNMVLDAAGIASGQAFLVSELEKRDPQVRTPLTSVTYPRDIVIETGGGWVDYTSAMSVAYGVTGGSGEGGVVAGGANGLPIVQASLDKGLYKAHVFGTALRVGFVDMQRSNFIGRSLDQILTDGVRMTYDKHMDKNTYIGIEEYGTTGLLNNPDVTETTVVAGESGDTEWTEKTADEILADVNTAITETWAAAEYDEDAIPNHILLPYKQYTSIINRKVSELGTKSIMDYIMENNIASKQMKDLFIAATRFNEGAGTGGSDRMSVYCNHEKYLKMEELVPLSRVMTTPNTSHVSYDTAYLANVSEVQQLYPQTATYWDGI